MLNDDRPTKHDELVISALPHGGYCVSSGYNRNYDMAHRFAAFTTLAEALKWAQSNMRCREKE